MRDEVTVDSIPDNKLVHRAIYSCRPTKFKPLWTRVMDMFSLGCTFSHQLCRKHGFNPDARKRSEMRSLPPHKEGGDG